MKIAIVRNTPNAQVIARRGRQNREFYKEADIQAVRAGLQEGGHDAVIVEGDKTLIPRLQEMHDSCKGEDDLEFIVFNLAYGVQGEMRYTHIPSMLELTGIPYVGSGPRGHTIALDKHLAKVVWAQNGLPTADFQLFERSDDTRRQSLGFPLIVKPQFESTSFGIQVVRDEEHLRAAVAAIIDEFHQPVLVEAFIAGIEVNCGTLGNDPPEALPVLQVDFGEMGDEGILSYEVKRDRVATHRCPAAISDELTKRVQELAVKACQSLGCSDASRVDFRIDSQERIYLLELNSMVAIHQDGSYFHAAREAGMTHPELINRVLNVALERYRARP